MRVHSSRDHLLNSKNENSSNCLTRLVVDEDRFQKKNREQKEEEEENEEQRRIHQFKEIKRSPDTVTKDVGRMEEHPTERYILEAMKVKR